MDKKARGLLNYDQGLNFEVAVMQALAMIGGVQAIVIVKSRRYVELTSHVREQLAIAERQQLPVWLVVGRQTRRVAAALKGSVAMRDGKILVFDPELGSFVHYRGE